MREIDETKNRAGLLSAEISEKPYLWAEQGSQIGNLCRLARLGSSPLGRRGRTRTTESQTYWAAQTNHDLGFNPIKHQHIPLSLRLGEDKESMSTWEFGGAADRDHAQGSSCSPSGSLDLVLRGGRSSRRVRGRGRKDERDAVLDGVVRGFFFCTGAYSIYREYSMHLDGCSILPSSNQTLERVGPTSPSRIQRSLHSLDAS